MDRLEENALTFALTKLGDNGGFARSRAAVGCVQPYSFQKKRQEEEYATSNHVLCR